MKAPRSVADSRLALLLRLLAGGRALGLVWEEAGFPSVSSAAAALEEHSAALSHPARETAGPPAPPQELWDGKPVARVVVHADGAARGNPGPAAAAAVAYDTEERRLASVSAALGEATNNVAEYRACLLALRLAARLGAERVEVKMDSELVVKQLRGEYHIRNDSLRRLAEEILAEARTFTSVTWERIPRKENDDADRLANETLDEARQG